MMQTMTEDAQYKLLRLLDKKPKATQREIARELGISLGKVNYCLHGLVEKGHIKVRNFTNSRNKVAYIYFLTPKGVNAKALITAAYLKRKVAEYEELQNEIATLTAEVEATTA